MRIDLASHKSLEQVRAFLEGLGADGGEPLLPERQEQYGHIQTSLVRFRYRTLRRAERGLVLEYLRRTTGLSRSQVSNGVALFSWTPKIAWIGRGCSLERRGQGGPKR